VVIDYRLLGTIEAAANGHVLDVAGHRQRALLAILLLSANEPVTRDTLIDKLWGDRAPTDAQHSLDVAVSRLRKALEPAAGFRVVATRPGAYVLHAEPEQVDVRCFERLAAQGRRALAAADPGEAKASLRAALAMWRGAPLADLGDEQFARPEIARLEEMRASVAEDLIEAELALGQHAEVLGELGLLVEADPLRERLAALLMIALYRSGRQPEALAVYRSARRALVDELGIEPGPELRRVERAILEQAAWLDLPRGKPAAEQPAATGRSSALSAPARRPRILVAAGAGLALAVVLAFLVGNADGAAGRATAGPDTVGVIDISRGVLEAVVQDVQRPGGVAFGDSSAWITDTARNLVLRANLRGRVIDPIHVGPAPGAVAVGGGEVWVADQLNGTVSEVNPASGSVVGSIRVGNGPGAMTYGFGSVWVANTTDSTVSRIAAGSGRPVATIPTGSSPTGIVAGFGGIWVVTGTGRALFVDPHEDRVTRSLPVGGVPVGVAVGGGRVWVAESGGSVARLDPHTGRLQRTRIGGSANGIAFAAGAVWVTTGAGHVARLNPRTGATSFVRVGNQPSAIAAAGGHLLTTVLPTTASHRGGTLTIIAQLFRPDETTDPARAWFTAEQQMLSVTNDGLVTYRRTGGPGGDTLVPDLATAIPAPTDGGRTYTFQVRPGIRYSNGELVGPGDFRRAIERVFAVGKNIGAAGMYTGIVGTSQCLRTSAPCDLSRGIVADAKTGTVTFHLTAPDPDFLYKLALPFAAAIAPGTPDHVLSATQIPATGPYMTSSYVPHHRWVLVRNPRFRQWSAAAQPRGYPDRIVLRLDVPSATAETNVERDRADVLLSPQARLHELTTRYPSLLHTGPQSGTVGLVLNTRAYPFTHRAARQAVNFAIDRSRLLRMIGGRLAGQVTCQILPPALHGYQPYCPYTVSPGPGGAWTGPDLSRAQSLVAASGTKGAKVTVVTGAFGTAIPLVTTGRYIVSILDQIGYRASLRVVRDYTAYDTASGDSRSKPQVSWFGWFTDFPTPSDMIAPVLTCHSFVPGSAANLNTAEFCDRSIDAQITRALTLQPSAPDAAGALWERIDREITDQAPWVPIYNPVSTVLLSPRVGNYQFDPNYQLLIDQLWVR
jgi:ABC-type transport system substrate-binding protein/DNA-binding SARP family transcriptional activator